MSLKPTPALGLAILLGACVSQGPTTQVMPIARHAPDDPTPLGIAYLCDGSKEVSVVYAKNRASVTFGGKTWRMEYQPTDAGFRYSDTATEWAGREDLASLHGAVGSTQPLAYNCRPTRRTS